MSAAACLLMFTLAVLIAAPPLLRWLTGKGYAPRLGVTAWLTAILVVLMSWLAALVLSIVDTVRFWNQGPADLSTCMGWLRAVAAGENGVLPQSFLAGTVAALSTFALIISVRLVRSVRRQRAGAREHADAVRIVGRPTGLDNVVVVPAENPAAYCVAGNPSTIVLTNATLTALDDRELAAVLAHERAHLSGRHSIILTALRSLTTTLPRVRMMSEAAQHIPRLLEMCADDAATRHHDRETLLCGLVALCGTAPSEAMAAADVAVLARARRLSEPHVCAGRLFTSAALILSITVLTAAPWITVLLACSGLISCDM